MKIVIFVPPEWLVDSTPPVHYNTINHMISFAREIYEGLPPPLKGKWYSEMSRCKASTLEYILAPWTGNALHACELPFFVVGELEGGKPRTSADMYVERDQLQNLLDNIDGVVKALGIRKKIHTVGWPSSQRLN